MGKSLQFAASLLDLWSTTPSSETHISKHDFTFLTIINYIIVLMSITFVWAIETSHSRITFGETDRWPKITQNEIYQHGQQFYERKHGKEPSICCLFVGSLVHHPKFRDPHIQTWFHFFNNNKLYHCTHVNNFCLSYWNLPLENYFWRNWPLTKNNPKWNLPTWPTILWKKHFHLLIIRYPQKGDVKLLFWGEAVGMGVIYRFYNTTSAYMNCFRNNK